MVEPAFEDRFPSASEALKALSDNALFDSAIEEEQAITTLDDFQYFSFDNYVPKKYNDQVIEYFTEEVSEKKEQNTYPVIKELKLTASEGFTAVSQLNSEKCVNKTTFKGLESPIKKLVTKVSLSKTFEGLSIHIPSRGSYQNLLEMTGGICMVIFCVLLAVLMLALLSGDIILGGIFFLMFFLGVCCLVSFLYRALFCAYVKYTIQINDDKFLYQWKFMGFGNKITGERNNITGIKKTYLGSTGSKRRYQLELFYGTKKFVFGAGLSPEEQEWIKSEINDFLEFNAA
jgi:hypothetical protein